VPIGIALFAAACGETRSQQAATGAAAGALAGGIVGGPVGALVGAGVGGVGGAYKETVEPQADRAVASAFKEADEAVQTAVSPDTPLSSQDVRQAQATLTQMGLYDGEIDGLYGKRTERAVRDFQARENLPRTGSLDERTKRELQMAAAGGGERRSSAERAPSSAPAAAATTGQGNDVLAANLIGREVVTTNNENVGQIQEVVVMRDGRPGAVVSLDEFMGIGKRTIVLNGDQLRLGGGASAKVRVNLTKEQLAQLPEYRAR
jgi:peptidoglycan hydrolase-like protein with peptidoglycan-binding domain